MNTNPRVHDNAHLVRLDDETERRLKNLAQRDGVAPAVLCRMAVRDFLRRDQILSADDPSKKITFCVAR